MVVDILPSGPEQILSCATLRDEDYRNSSKAFCALHPQAVLHSSDFHSADVPRSSPASRNLTAIRMNPEDGANSSKPQRMNSSKRDSTGRCENGDRSQHGTPEGKITRSCKRKLDLMLLSVGSHDATTTYDPEKKDLESPPQAKRWVIGPLLQSFKSKMANFTEIVMSPVRLFKPSELPVSSNSKAPSVSPENTEGPGLDRMDDVFTHGEEKLVRCLRFDTSSISLSNSQQNPVTISQNGSEHRPDSDDGSFESLQSARSAKQVTGASKVQHCYSEEKQNCDSVSSYPLPPNGLVEDLDSGRISIKDESEKAVKRLIVLCEKNAMEELQMKQVGQPDVSNRQDQDQTLARNVRLSTHAVQNKKKGQALEESEQADMVREVGKDGRADWAEAFPALVRTETLRNSSKRRKVRILDDGVSGSSDGNVQDVASCDPSVRENMGLARASRSRTKRENELRCSLISLETNGDATKSVSSDLQINATHDATLAQAPPSTASKTWASTRTKRWHQSNKTWELRKSAVAEGRCGDPPDLFRPSNRTAVRRNTTRQAKHELKTTASPTANIPQVSKKSWNMRRVKRATETFEDQGMSMSLTVKVGSGLEEEKEAGSIVTCGITTRDRKMGGDVMLSEASCLSRATPEGCFCDVLSENLKQKDEPSTCVYLNKIETLQDVDWEEKPTRASRSRTKRENDLRCSLISLETNGDATKSVSGDLQINATHDATLAQAPPSTASETWASTRTKRWHQSNKTWELRKSAVAEGRCGDPPDPSRPSNRTAVRRNTTRQAKHESETTASPTANMPQVSKKSWNMRRVKRATETFEDQGMSMSLTLKVGSGLEEGKEAGSIVTCGMTRDRKMGEDVIVAEASCPSRATPEGCFCDVLSENLKHRDEPRTCRVYLNKIETLQDVDWEEKPTPTSSGSGATRLMRSLSCPDIGSMPLANAASANEQSLQHPPCSPLKKVSDLNVRSSSPIKRTRRHTVCSVELEREIVPMCLRKEVYPKCSGASVPSNLHVPSKSLASLVSCFLSSPLAFLSKKSTRGHGDDGGYGARSCDLVVACSSSSPSPPSPHSPTSSDVTSGSAFFADAPHTPEQSSKSSHCSMFEVASMEVDEGVVQLENEENEQSDAVTAVKALSDSEIKADNKQVEGRKVSSIRIRKTLPKPQYNLTPMGLPKAVRLKKKVFSVEEIYTNKNFSKPPEGRLETIFEVPFHRRDGSQSLIGPKRVKRFIEFPELGVARKPRRPLVFGAGGGGAQRKAAGNPGAGRTRRGREEEALQLQDLDSVLCSKLRELDVWMATKQMVH